MGQEGNDQTRARRPASKVGSLSEAEGDLSSWLPDDLDEWAKLSPDERLRQTLRLHRLLHELERLRE